MVQMGEILLFSCGMGGVSGEFGWKWVIWVSFMLYHSNFLVRGRMIPKKFFRPNELIFTVEGYFGAGSAFQVVFWGITG